MPFEIILTEEALEDLQQFKKHKMQRIGEAIENQLIFQPGHETRNRKKLRPNPLAEWELRVGDFRVFYVIDFSDNQVKIVAVGWKVGSRLYLHGEAFEL